MGEIKHTQKLSVPVTTQGRKGGLRSRDVHNLPNAAVASYHTLQLEMT